MDSKNFPKFKNVIDEIPPEYIVTLQGNKYIRIAGLQFLMDRLGVYRVATSCIRCTANEVIYEAKVWVVYSDEYLASKGITKDSPGIEILSMPTCTQASVNDKNANPNIGAKFRDALCCTRAIARAFRFITGCPYTGLDELDGRDIKRMAEEADISVESLEDMIEKEQAATVKKGLAQQTVTISGTQSLKVDPFFTPVDRAGFIKALKGFKADNKGVNEYIKTYLDNHNAMVLENLTDDNLKEMYKASAKLINGA